MTNSSRTIRDPSPMYFCTSSPPLTRMKVQSVWCATARASSVLPDRGGGRGGGRAQQQVEGRIQGLL